MDKSKTTRNKVTSGLTLIQENGWNAVNANGVTRNNDIIPNGLAPGGVTTIQIRFLADENVSGILENGAEIARGDNAFMIADCDSNADTNGNNDPLINDDIGTGCDVGNGCLLYTSPSPRDRQKSRMPSSA